MAKPTRSIDQRLLEAQIAIDNSLSTPVILEAVTLFGYDAARLQAARTLLDEVLALVAAQKLEYGEQYEATAVLQAAWDEAKAVYIRALKIARIAFKGNEKARNGLRLSGKRKQSLSGWLEEATVFYTNMLATPDFIAAMTPYSYDQAKLAAESALVAAVATAKAAQDKERGEAQEATKVRDAKLDELDQWLADYKAIAHVALEESPQQLEQLGWVVAS